MAKISKEWHMTKIPQEWRKYFWDVKPEKINLKKHAFYVLGRVLEYGHSQAVQCVRELYGDQMIKRLLLSTYSRSLSNRTMQQWQTILKLKPEECKRISSLRSKNPTWNY
jgi:hypothetical protein